MAKYKSVMTRLFEKVKVAKKGLMSFKSNEAGTGFVSFSSGGNIPMDVSEKKDGRLEFDKDAVLKEMNAPPMEIKLGQIAVKTHQLKQLIKGLKAKKLETAIYSKALQQLVNRKIYPQVKDHVEALPITNNKLIQELIKKYKLVFRPMGGITKEMPLEVVEALDKFCQPLEKAGIVFGREDFYLIAPEDWWQKERDPILLVESPFGNYFYIICAWDKEVDILGELFEE